MHCTLVTERAGGSECAGEVALFLRRRIDAVFEVHTVSNARLGVVATTTSAGAPGPGHGGTYGDLFLLRAEGVVRDGNPSRRRTRIAASDRRPCRVIAAATSTRHGRDEHERDVCTLESHTFLHLTVSDTYDAVCHRMSPRRPPSRRGFTV